MSNVNELTQEIHTRRLGLTSEADPVVAEGEALLFTTYAVEPLLDHFQGKSMDLALPDVRGRILTVLRAVDGCARFSPLRCEDADVLVFYQEGSGLIGWMPSEFAQQAEQILLDERSSGYEVRQQFMLPMPNDFDFETPDTSTLIKVWSFSDNGWWTDAGYFLYERGAAERVEQLGQQLAG